MIEGPLMAATHFGYLFSIERKSISESLENLFFCLCSLDEIRVSRNIIVILKLIQADTAGTLRVNNRPSLVNNSLSSLIQFRAEGLQKVANIDWSRRRFKRLCNCLHLDLRQENSRRPKHFLKRSGSDWVIWCRLMQVNWELSKRDSLLLLEVHTHVTNDPVGFDVEANAVKLRHFCLITDINLTIWVGVDCTKVRGFLTTCINSFWFIVVVAGSCCSADAKCCWRIGYWPRSKRLTQSVPAGSSPVDGTT